MSLVEAINHGIKEAMRSKDQIRLETLRMLKSKILAVDARGGLSDADVVKLFKTYLGNLEESYEQFFAAARHETAEKLKKEMQIVMEFLPKAPSLEETKAFVEVAIAETCAKSPKDFGVVMKHVMKACPHVDGKVVKQIADELLKG